MRAKDAQKRRNMNGVVSATNVYESYDEKTSSGESIVYFKPTRLDKHSIVSNCYLKPTILLRENK